MLLAVDPFSQATVQYYSCRRLTSGSTTIPSGNTYAITLHANRAGDQLILDTGMEQAIYTGIINPPANSSRSVDVACATGNCTFPSDQDATFNTLGMCYICIDQSDLVVSSPGHYPILPTDLTGNPYLNTGWGLIAVLPSLQGPQLDYFTQLNTTLGSNQTLPDGPWNVTTLTGFRGIARKYDPNCNWDSPNLGSSQLCDGDQLIAFDCAFQACVKTYGASVIDGIYNEHEISRQPLHAFGSTDIVYRSLRPSAYLGSLWEVALNRTLVNGAWQDCTPSREPSAIKVVPMAGPGAQTFSSSSLEENSTLISWYRPECVYNISSLTDDYLRPVFDNQSLYSDTDAPFTQGPSWLKGIYNQGNINMSAIDNFAAGLAVSMESHIRGHPSDDWPGRQGVVGQVWANDSCIRVRWGFLSWLAILLVLELVFFGKLLVSVAVGPSGISWKSLSVAGFTISWAGLCFAQREGFHE